MIFYVGKSSQYISESFSGFRKWLGELSVKEVEFDIETNVTPHWCTKKIHTVQFGNQDDQWVLEWKCLSAEEKGEVRRLLESHDWMKLIHNAQFECVVCLFHGIRVRNVFDTMLAEKVLFGGENTLIGYSLEELCDRRLGVQLDKQYQTSFGTEAELTVGQIGYAAQDVSVLTLLKKEIYQQAQQYGLEWTIALENESILVFSEMVYYGMELDVSWWMKLADEVEPLIGDAEEHLNAWLKEDTFYPTALKLGYIKEADQLNINWNSPPQKKALFAELFPHIPGTTKAILTRYRSDKIKAGQEYEPWLNELIEGDHSTLQSFILSQHKDFLIQTGRLTTAGTPTINWNSTDQVLPIIQVVERVKNLSAESLGRTSHPIIADYEEYKDTAKLASSYGSDWPTKKMEPDGCVRTTFNPVLTTGRIASAKPNMQQIPAKESVGNKYRNAFIPPKGFKFVSSDYVSQELIVIAYLSNDPVWIEALSKGQDLHSITAEMVFGSKWKEAAEVGCAYYKSVDGIMQKQKCKCNKHKYMRNGIKTINFGLAYGMSKFKLSSTLRIPVPEADKLILDYFHAFPNIGNLLTYLGNFGVMNGYIQTIWPFYRKRWFPHWRYYRNFIDSHLMGAQYHPGLGEIERASKNMPIQGASADTMKLALCMIYWEIHDVRCIADKVRMIMQVHDQVDTAAVDDYAEEWKEILTQLMESAAKVIIPTGILKSDTTITSRWSK